MADDTKSLTSSVYICTYLPSLVGRYPMHKKELTCHLWFTDSINCDRASRGKVAHSQLILPFPLQTRTIRNVRPVDATKHSVSWHCRLYYVLLCRKALGSPATHLDIRYSKRRICQNRYNLFRNRSSMHEHLHISHWPQLFGKIPSALFYVFSEH